jgi:hypothetical protein
MEEGSMNKAEVTIPQGYRQCTTEDAGKAMAAGIDCLVLTEEGEPKDGWKTHKVVGFAIPVSDVRIEVTARCQPVA